MILCFCDFSFFDFACFSFRPLLFLFVPFPFQVPCFYISVARKSLNLDNVMICDGTMTFIHLNGWCWYCMKCILFSECAWFASAGGIAPRFFVDCRCTWIHRITLGLLSGDQVSSCCEQNRQGGRSVRCRPGRFFLALLSAGGKTWHKVLKKNMTGMNEMKWNRMDRNGMEWNVWM